MLTNKATCIYPVNFQEHTITDFQCLWPAAKRCREQSNFTIQEHFIIRAVLFSNIKVKESKSKIEEEIFWVIFLKEKLLKIMQLVNGGAGI